VGAITTENIECYRGALTLRSGDLPFDIWKVFERAAFDVTENARVVAVQSLVSTKNQLLDPDFVNGIKADPRQTAFKSMTSAALGFNERRLPLKVFKADLNSFQIVDGNATAQVLMLVGWKEVPVEIVEVEGRNNSISISAVEFKAQL
jgi:hypothetical protein